MIWIEQKMSSSSIGYFSHMIKKRKIDYLIFLIRISCEAKRHKKRKMRTEHLKKGIFAFQMQKMEHINTISNSFLSFLAITFSVRFFLFVSNWWSEQFVKENRNKTLPEIHFWSCFSTFNHELMINWKKPIQTNGSAWWILNINGSWILIFFSLKWKCQQKFILCETRKRFHSR